MAGHSGSSIYMNNYITDLPSLGILEISGEDAASFLHGQMTGNMDQLAEGQSCWSAWCHASGRVIALFLVTMTAGHYYLILPADMTEPVCRRLKMFVLRARVKVDDITGQYGCLGVGTGDNEPDTEWLNRDLPIVRAAIPNDMTRAICIAARNGMPALFSGLAAHGIRTTDEQDWRLRDIAAGIPWIQAQTTELALPQELNLERLGGLSYDKGCYPGQEVIARLHFRGRQKRLLCAGVLDPIEPLPVTGSKLSGHSGAQAAGFVLAAARESTGRIRLLMLVDTGLAAGETVTLESGAQVRYSPIAPADNH